MEYFIGVGGIGCKALYRYQQQRQLPEHSCYYVDSDPSTSDLLPDTHVYILQGLSCGSGMIRNVGRSAVLQDLFRGNMRGYFDEIINQSEVSLRIVTSSFGGFGGAAASQIMDYLLANTWGRQKDVCTVYALSESVFQGKGFPRPMMDQFESNTFDFVRDFSDRISATQVSLSDLFSSSVFVSQCRLWLLDGSSFESPDDFGLALDMDEAQLAKASVHERYLIRPKATAPSVFISYSFSDQTIADMVTEAIERKGTRCWIASRDMKEGSYPRQIMQQIRSSKVFLVLLSKSSVASEHVKTEIDRAFSRLKEGLAIVPFVIEDAELDDDCIYYLCRQERFSGLEPPLEERVEELAEMVHEIVSDQRL